jgi:hypothetical protein
MEFYSAVKKNGPKHREQCRRYHNTRLQIILQSLSNKNSTVLIQRPMEKKIEVLKIKPYSYSHLIFDKKSQKHTREKMATSTNDAWKTGYQHTED